jgi:hypothetical protein
MGMGGGRAEKNRGQGVAFAEPSFFAESALGRRKGGGEDPRDGLMGMFGEGFRLEEEKRGEGGEGGGWFRRLVGGGDEKATGKGKGKSG